MAAVVVLAVLFGSLVALLVAALCCVKRKGRIPLLGLVKIGKERERERDGEEGGGEQGEGLVIGLLHLVGAGIAQLVVLGLAVHSVASLILLWGHFR